MNIAYYIWILILLTSFSYAQNSNDIDTTGVAEQTKSLIDYTAPQLERYLDSIGHLPTEGLARKVSFLADSTFEHRISLNKTISTADFNRLKQAIAADEDNRRLDLKTIQRIFGVAHLDSAYIEGGSMPISVISFDKKQSDVNEFAICLGYPDSGWRCTLYFFKGRRLLAQHTIEHHYGLELQHYKDSDGKTVIYYKENFGTGSGIWQFNFYFYKYDENKLIPILNELENGNLQCCWGIRMYWLEASVVKTTPLTLKMVYYQELYDTAGLGQRVIDDSTYIQYTWDEPSKTLIGNYEQAKINKAQTLTYYLADNELLFINSYYPILKACLEDKSKRGITLNYLNLVKNHYEHR